MLAFPWTCFGRPATAKSQAAHVSIPPIKTEGLSFMMTQSSLDAITFSPADRAELAPLVENWYQEALLLLKQADKIREAANLPLPAAAVELYGALLPRQAVSR